jgi:predicted transcriptional regulator
LTSSVSYRSQTKLLVSLSPGIHVRRLQKLLGASFTTTRYHVDILERDGEIVRSKDGRYDRLYPAGTAEGMKAVYAVLQSKTARKVLQALADCSPQELTNGDLSERTNLPRSTVSECIRHVVGASMVRRYVTMDGRILYELQDKEEVLRLLGTFKRSVLNAAADRFIDLWDL